MKNQIIGLLAHVDAGKTTLSEALLYTAGKIRKLGRVDWRNTFLDTHELERERGITIFSKQAIFEHGDSRITLMDTPGHVDFAAETERILPVLDAAVLVVSGSEGTQTHTETLWSLLERYRVPTFVFVTKTDLAEAAGIEKSASLRDLADRLSSACVDFSEPADLCERIAMTDEHALDAFLDSGALPDAEIARLIRERKLFPTFFGSGLRLTGVPELLDALTRLAPASEGSADPDSPFAARVYKIGHDPDGARLTYLRVTGGSLSVRQSLSYLPEGADEQTEEKITGIRFYSGAKFESAERADRGEVCAVTGLSGTFAGQGLGADDSSVSPGLEPVLRYKIALPKEADPRTLFRKLRALEEEEPLLHLVWNERYGEIHAQIMGPVQTEVLSALIRDRFGVPVSFEDGRILYKETVSAAVEGVGHFEPLRHYAEVHLLIQPGERGSGLTFDSACSENLLERNWQRLILTHLEEKQHLGVLTGSPITDLHITLAAGKAHLKHTVGGDFREATYRAVREGLMFARAAGACVLLEPYYAFRLEIPASTVGRAISDILARDGTFREEETVPGISVLTGRAPVASFGDYAKEVAAYTHGHGRLSVRVEGYFPCHNAAEVIERADYDPQADLDNSPDSVFCSHGAGVVVPWHQVPEVMHLDAIRLPESGDSLEPTDVSPRRPVNLDEKELEAIMEREFGPIRRPVYGDPKEVVTVNGRAQRMKKSLYIVDGYNVIFAWDELAAAAQTDLEYARRMLCEVLANYQAYTGRDMIVVFDAYNVKGSVERKFDYHGLHVVYTKEGELGDTYMERLIHEIGKDWSVRVVTSDGMIQLQAVRSGVLRLSAREFREEVVAVDEEIAELLRKLKG